MTKEMIDAARERFVGGHEDLKSIAEAIGADEDELCAIAVEDSWRAKRNHRQLYDRLRAEPVPPEIEAARARFVNDHVPLTRLSEEMQIGYDRLKRYSYAFDWKGQRSACSETAPELIRATEVYLTTMKSIPEAARETGADRWQLRNYLHRNGLRKDRVEMKAKHLKEYMEANRESIERAERDHVEGGISLRGIARRYRLGVNQIQNIAAQLGWKDKQNEYRKMHGLKLYSHVMNPALTERLRMEYITGEFSCRTLAQKHDLPISTVENIAGRDHWLKDRKAYRAQVLAGEKAGTDPAVPQTGESNDQSGQIELLLRKAGFPMQKDERINAAVLDYISGVAPLETIARKRGIPFSTLNNLRATYNLAQVRKDYAALLRKEGCRQLLAQDIDILTHTRRCAARSLEGMDETIEAMISRVADAPDWKSLAEALACFVRLDYSTSGRLTPAEQAKHDLAMEKIALLKKKLEIEEKRGKEDGKPQVFRVEWADGIEELAK